MKKPTFLSRFALFWVFSFLYAPIFVMMVLSFNASKSRTTWGGFSLQWYQSLFHNDLILSSLTVTLIIAAVSALVAAAVGTVTAIGLFLMKAKPRRTLLTVNNIPVTNPDIITGVSLMLLFVAGTGILRHLGIQAELGFATILLAHISFNIPYVILSVMPKLRGLAPGTYDAALDLGAPPLTAIRRVIVPQAMPGIVSGTIIAFTMSLDDFLISYFTAGSDVQTLPMTIYSMTRKRLSPEISALSTLLFLSVLVLLVVINLIQSKDRKKVKS